jgi:peptidoglycan/xylan/chitin deacetylase (PgdA/CDA1 family)
MPTASRKLRVLNFHGIGTPHRVLDPLEDVYWIDIDRFRYVLDRIAVHSDRERLFITFDDSNISDFLIAVPELQRRGLSAKFFVLTGRIGDPGSLGAEDIRALLQMGMRIGSHGIAHRDWTSLSARELNNELNGSKATLERICGEPVRCAAIPFGRYNAAVLAALQKAGYVAAYSSDGGCMQTTAFLRPRTSIRHDTLDGELTEILSGKMSNLRWLRRAAAMAIKRWV